MSTTSQPRYDDVLPQHKDAEARLGQVRSGVQREYADKPEVLALSDRMKEERHTHSHENPDMSNSGYLYSGMLKDAKLQFEAAANGQLDSQDARDVPATSSGPFFNIVRNAPPQNFDETRDALLSVVTGAATQMTYGHAPENPFLESTPDLIKK
ncbi:MAG: hypothetical protein ACTHU0_07390 [Kofleriaceae bacterium]